MSTLLQTWRPGAARSQMCHERPSISTSFPSIWLPRVSFDAQLARFILAFIGHDLTGRRTFTGKNRNVYRSISMFSRDDIVVQVWRILTAYRYIEPDFKTNFDVHLLTSLSAVSSGGLPIAGLFPPPQRAFWERRLTRYATMYSSRKSHRDRTGTFLTVIQLQCLHSSDRAPFRFS